MSEQTVNITLTDEEKEKLEAAAKAHKLELDDFIKKVALYATEKGSH